MPRTTNTTTDTPKGRTTMAKTQTAQTAQSSERAPTTPDDLETQAAHAEAHAAQLRAAAEAVTDKANKAAGVAWREYWAERDEAMPAELAAADKARADARQALDAAILASPLGKAFLDYFLTRARYRALAVEANGIDEALGRPYGAARKYPILRSGDEVVFDPKRAPMSGFVYDAIERVVGDELAGIAAEREVEIARRRQLARDAVYAAQHDDTDHTDDTPDMPDAA